MELIVYSKYHQLTCETVVEVIDTENPELVCPPSINQCADAGQCYWTADGSVNPVTSDCGTTTLSYNVTNPDGSVTVLSTLVAYQFDLGSSTIEVTSTDDSNPTNSSTCNFTVNITDCEDPTIVTCPVAQTTIECGSEDIASWAMTLAGNDNCDINLSESYFVLSQTNNCGGTSTSVYVFVVTDDAGNSASCTSTYTTIDTVYPLITGSATSPMVTCMEDNTTNFLSWLSLNGAATATDGCSGPVVWTNDWDGSLPNGCAGMTAMTITFTATDDCGNTSTTTGTYTITDTTPPMLTTPENLVLECGNTNNDGIVQNWLASAQGIDECSSASVINDYSGLPTTCNVPVIITFTATDNCMNSSTSSRTITLTDNIKPVIMNSPADLIVECGMDNTTSISDWLNSFGGGMAIDNCDTPTITFVAVDSEEMCGSSTTTEYIFTATDACGNSITEVANLITIDTTDPELTLPTGASTVSCEASPDPDAWAATATAVDSCDVSPTVSFVLTNIEETCSGTTQQTVYTYAFTGVDACGNVSEVMTADYTVTDSSVPSLMAPADLSIDCGQDISLLVTEWLDDVVASDNCDDVSELTVTSDFDASMLMNACGATIPVTWIVTDNCGGTNTAMSNIVIASDSEGPEVDL